MTATNTQDQVHEHAILVVDDDLEFLESMRLLLISNNFKNVKTLSDSSAIFRELSQCNYSIVLLDWLMPGNLSGESILPQISNQYPDIPVIIMTGVSDTENIVNCIKDGAYDYITKPPDTSRLITTINKALEHFDLYDQNRRLTGYLLGEPLSNPDIFSTFITCNEKMQSIFKIIESLAPSRQPILITGETGVGKDLIAEAIHKSSGVKGAFVPINVAGMDDAMLADTLFGHKKGAYTHANDSRNGLIEQAKGGTLFLDEIGDLSTPSQLKLLRLIQQKEYYRLGSDVLQKSDARIIAASNANFVELLASKIFRADLYHRLSTHRIHIEPLRNRREDILPLVKHFLGESARELNKKVPVLGRDAKMALQAYDFSGNVRELINMISHAITYNSSGTLELADFPGLKASDKVHRKIISKQKDGKFALCGLFTEFPTLEEIDELLVVEAMRATENVKTQAADLLGITRPTLQKKLDAILGKTSEEGM
jgi:DNA-binding NtrC family response regulator